MLAVLTDWFATLSLVFGGCCSNAITLEQLTSQYPQVGSLITFLQYLIVSIHGIPKHITWTRYGPRFKPRRIPLTPYLIQVALYYLVSLLNNAAFAYRIPMAVHIIFRSGGLMISMTLGWLFAKKTYTPMQIISVLIVTLGVMLTTLSASSPQKSIKASSIDTNLRTYFTGILILTIALVFAGFLGLVQDHTYSTYSKSPKSAEKSTSASPPPPWQESMFYLHFLGLPMFLSVRDDLTNQIKAVSTSPITSYSLPMPSATQNLVEPGWVLSTASSTSNASSPFTPLPYSLILTPYLLNIFVPQAILPLILNTLTQLLCSAGVNRLTSRVTSLTVTLILVVRKAVSLVISATLGKKLGLGGNAGREIDMPMMWSGAALVMLGTVGYSMATSRRNAKRKAAEKKSE
ncbi:golgi uridine diphosphate-N-acetylglucosamine transporter [Stygiomarasmius scandens]|uniref:Golgi uridine diphosphate-N-acetylglucosamine transporter n=1 Tax=Marasmiellus scandens TaxID=2682957 RepID=A0ABR1K628_9AGAR